MTIYYFLVCPETKKMFWVGQSSMSSRMDILYSNNEDGDDLREFLVDHQDKAIYLRNNYWVDEQSEEYEDWYETRT